MSQGIRESPPIQGRFARGPESGATPAHVAAEFANLEAARLRLERGPDGYARALTDASAVGGRSPIFDAATQCGDNGLSMVQFLVENGADLPARSRLPGRTIEFLAARGGEEGSRSWLCPMDHACGTLRRKTLTLTPGRPAGNPKKQARQDGRKLFGTERLVLDKLRSKTIYLGANIRIPTRISWPPCR